MDKELKIIRIIPSKSYAHRAYICDFLAGECSRDTDSEVGCLPVGGSASEIVSDADWCEGALDLSSDDSCCGVICDLDSDDINATRECIEGLRCGAEIIDVHESGSTLRFIMPLAGVLGKAVLIRTRGRLSERPMGPFEDELVQHGMKIEHEPSGIIRVSGKLTPGEYRLPGAISSQFITGLLLSLPYLDGDSTIVLTSELQSSAYVDITMDVLKSYGVGIRTSAASDHAYNRASDSEYETAQYMIPGGQHYHRETPYIVEGDWSQAAFWLAAGTIGSAPVRVTGLNTDSVQGDRKMVEMLRSFGARIEIGANNSREGFADAYPSKLHGITVDVSEIPDLAPAIACAGAAAEGETRLVNAGRLRYKESDRIKSIVECLKAVGISAEEREDEIIISGCGGCSGCGGIMPAGGAVDAAGDHRIVMMAAILSLITKGKVAIEGSDAVSKSYPTFFRELERAGMAGNILKVSENPI